MSPRAALKCVLTAALGLGLGGPAAWADQILETVYLPTTAVVPTSVLVPTTSYVTTAATVPSTVLPGVYATSYSTTASYAVLRPASVVVEPTTYVLQPTVYEAPRGLGARLRRWANRPAWGETVLVDPVPTYLATSYWPTTTTLDVPVLSATTIAVEDPCAISTTTVAPSVPAETHSRGAAPVNPPASQAAPVNPATPETRTSRPPAQIDSTPSNGGGTPSGVPVSPAPAGSTPAGTNGSGEPTFEFPQTPAPEKAPDGGLQTPPTDTETSRTVFRPMATELNARPALAGLGAIRGEVVSATSRAAQAKVRVVFSDVQRTYADKGAETDANGRFEVALPNGDWTVNVVESDGKLTPYGQITASNGRFFDERGRAVASLRLNH